jgi:hypothetical protein
MRYLFCALLTLSSVLPAIAQQSKTWTSDDRKYLLGNLSRSRDSVIIETRGLSKAQWNFKESPERWSIAEIVEHLCLWEILFQREVGQALETGEHPELFDARRTDSGTLAFLAEEKQHIAPEYTKPFTYTVPMGLNEGKNNLAWLLKMRNESLGYIDTTKANLKVYFMRQGRGSVHQRFVSCFGHTDRHLRQIRKVKLHPNYPRK